MHKALAVLVWLLIALGPVAADDEKRPAAKPKPLTPEQTADAGLEAVKDNDAAALKALAEKDNPDPWLVADELCYRGEHDAAEAFANASPRKALEKLPTYVASRRGKPPDKEVREAFAAMTAALRAKNWKRALDVVAEGSAQLDSVVGIRIACYRGLALRGLGRRAESAEVLRRAGQAARELGWFAWAAAAFHQSAMSAYHAGDWPRAEVAWKQRLEIERSLDNAMGIAKALSRLGVVAWSVGRAEQALRYYEQSLAIFREQGHRKEVAAGHNNIGLVHNSLGTYSRALPHYEQAVEILRDLGDRARLGAVLANLGLVQSRLGAYAKALASLEASLEIARKLGSTNGTAQAHNNTGLVYEKLGNYAEALRHHEAALALFRQLDIKAELAGVLNNIANIHESLGAYDRARVYYDRARKQYAALGDRVGVATVLHNLAHMQRNRGDYPTALALLEESLKLGSEGEDPVEIAMTLVNIGSAHVETGSYEQARLTYDRAGRLLKDDPNPYAQALLAWGVAGLHLAQNDLVKAAQEARRGVEYVTEQAQGLAETEGPGARDAFTQVFEIGALATLRGTQPAELLWFLEHGRAGTLREGLDLRRTIEAAVIPDDLQAALASARQAARRALSAYERARTGGDLAALRSARKGWVEARAEILRVGARIQRETRRGALLALSPPDDLAAVQRHLQPGEALLLFAVTSAEGVALVVRKDGARAVALPASKEIEAATDALLNAELYVDPDKLPALRRMLVAPLGLGTDVKRILVSPAGRLGYVPFALLFPEKEVAYVPSATSYGLLLGERTERGKGILALGDPNYRAVSRTAAAVHRGTARNGLAPLPATREEVDAIGTTKLLGAKASETGLQGAVEQVKRWRAVHFACHGLVDPERPMLSALALTADQENDGFLTALEISRMKIPADLVVMSACETGKGRIYKTEGIVGLTRAFIFAGAPRVICSLWKVDDEATQAVMIKFYELWNPKEGKGIGAAAALKKAQAFIKSHDKWKHPYYWAAWVLWGLPE